MSKRATHEREHLNPIKMLSVNVFMCCCFKIGENHPKWKVVNSRLNQAYDLNEKSRANNQTWHFGFCNKMSYENNYSCVSIPKSFSLGWASAGCKITTNNILWWIGEWYDYKNKEKSLI